MWQLSCLKVPGWYHLSQAGYSASIVSFLCRLFMEVSRQDKSWISQRRCLMHSCMMRDDAMMRLLWRHIIMLSICTWALGVLHHHPCVFVEGPLTNLVVLCIRYVDIKYYVLLFFSNFHTLGQLEKARDIRCCLKKDSKVLTSRQT